jgi:hypothetical protein
MCIENLNVSIAGILGLLGADEHIVKIIRTHDFENIDIQRWQKQELTVYHQKLVDIVKDKVTKAEINAKKLQSRIIVSETDY